MQLSLNSPCSSGTFLLLLLSNFFQWENVASLPVCAMKNGKCIMSVRDLFARAAVVSQELSTQSAQLLTEFEKQYIQDRGFLHRDFNSCPTSNLATPGNKEQAEQMQPKDLLKLLVSILGVWKQPLKYLVTEMGHMQGTTAAILSKARDIEETYEGLLEGMKAINSQVQTTTEEKEDYPVSPGLVSLQSVEGDARLYSLYSLINCLSRDLNKVDTYVKLLRCQMFYPNDC